MLNGQFQLKVVPVVVESQSAPAQRFWGILNANAIQCRGNPLRIETNTHIHTILAGNHLISKH